MAVIIAAIIMLTTPAEYPSIISEPPTDELYEGGGGV